MYTVYQNNWRCPADMQEPDHESSEHLRNASLGAIFTDSSWDRRNPSPYRLVSLWPQMVVSSLMSLLIGHGPEQLNINKPVIMEGIQKSGAQVSEKLHKRRFRTGAEEQRIYPGQLKKATARVPASLWVYTSAWGSLHLQHLIQGCVPQTLLWDRSGIYIV